LTDGTPWLVEAATPQGPVRVLSSRLDPDETSLPLEAAMVPLVEWLLSAAPDGVGRGRVESGSLHRLPAGATVVESPAGERFPVDRTGAFRFREQPGIYTVLGEDSVRARDTILARIAVNPPLRESLLTPLAEEARAALFASASPVLVSDGSAWRNRVFTRRRGSEAWRMLLAAALLLLAGETWVASQGGRAERSRPSATPTGAGHARVR
ncbi:MAG: hypothetical protein RQ751_03495, partial [Longimicrobiales bacterium]|nr:hypothetical protein [Longimicrobiales bacterium]